ncbi:MAG: energy transducer TonB [Candidatus Omnitrophica bacterium]|nr:energy transducer TonB [Candidatus Omnitrophota bacterium]
MKNFLLYEKGFFIPALFVSATVHGLLIGAGGWISSVPYASVLQAPSSLEVTVIHYPVVSVIEEEIVSEEIMDSEAFEEVVFSDQRRELPPEKNVPSSTASQESRGALTKAGPLAHMNPAPPYPRVARQRGWEGTVRLEVFVSKDGIPGTVGIDKSSGHDVLDRAALQTVREWKFIPARSGSIRFSSRITIPVQFSLIKERP